MADFSSQGMTTDLYEALFQKQRSRRTAEDPQHTPVLPELHMAEAVDISDVHRFFLYMKYKFKPFFINDAAKIAILESGRIP